MARVPRRKQAHHQRNDNDWDNLDEDSKELEELEDLEDLEELKGTSS